MIMEKYLLAKGFKTVTKVWFVTVIRQTFHKEHHSDRQEQTSESEYTSAWL
jgi:hypothetical protein